MNYSFKSSIQCWGANKHLDEMSLSIDVFYPTGHISFQVLWPCFFIPKVTASHYSVIESNGMLGDVFSPSAAPCWKSQICMRFFCTMKHLFCQCKSCEWKKAHTAMSLIHSRLMISKKERHDRVDKAAAAFTPLPRISSLGDWLPKLTMTSRTWDTLFVAGEARKPNQTHKRYQTINHHSEGEANAYGRQSKFLFLWG